MFKDYNKYLSTSLKVYLFVLVIIFIMKMVGLDYFGLDVDNLTITKISEFILKYNLEIIWYIFTYYVYNLMFFSITLNREVSKKVCLIASFISLIVLNFIKPMLPQAYNLLLDFFYLYIIVLILNKFKNKRNLLKRYTIVTILNVLFQFISLIIRDVGNNEMYYDNFIYGIILNFDYILLSLITYKIYFMKGDKKICGEAISSSLKKLNLKNLLTKLQKNWRNFKKQDKVTKLTYIIYFILSLIWNTFSVVLILLVAKLNDTFIECIFILTSFWLSKKSFGKAFHFSSMAKCFIVSNLSYYILNRITTPLGISIIVPILLGVGLSYVTSKLVKKTYKTLYRGMPEELFEETILKVVDKDSVKYNICYDFYIKNKSIISLAIKYNYTESGIRKIKDRVNEKIKRLN